jgi:hypothetical protein
LFFTIAQITISGRAFIDNSVKLFFKHWILHNLTIQFNALQYAAVTKNSQILNGNAAISDGFRVAHSYLAKSDLDKLIIDGDKDMLYNDCSNERNNNKNLPIPVC